MKPDEPSRTALMIARQRAAHQVLDHGSILYDPFAMKILREDEKEVGLQGTPNVPSLGKTWKGVLNKMPAFGSLQNATQYPDLHVHSRI